jgi:hypothetical protein
MSNGWESGRLGVREGKGRKGQLTSSKKPGGMGFTTMNKGLSFKVRFFFSFFTYHMHPWYNYNMYLWVLDKKKETLCAG